MTIARLYHMQAAPGKADALATALEDLAKLVRTVEGNEGVELLKSVDDAESFTFIEKWVSVAAHKKCLEALDKQIVAPMRAALGKPPEAFYLDYVMTI